MTGIQINLADLLGPLGLLAFLLLCIFVGVPWIRNTVERLVNDRIKSLENDIIALKAELSHCQTQHAATMAQMLDMASQNGYLRGRIEALEGK